QPILVCPQPDTSRHGAIIRRPRRATTLHGAGDSGGWPWSDDVKFHATLLIDWGRLASDPVARDYLAFCCDLIALRRRLPALRSESLRVSTRNSLDRVIAIHRWIEGSGEDVLVVANLQEQSRFGYRIGVPSAGTWREVFNSDGYEAFPNRQAVGNAG